MSGVAWSCVIGSVLCLLAGAYQAVERGTHHYDFERGHRFKDDNAVGATANAAELIHDGLMKEQPWVWYAVALIVVCQLVRIRDAVQRQGDLLEAAMQRKKQPAAVTTHEK